ncbi:hypothetical protein E2C01_069244 [Portunus trituberculatus]|uniref:Uncharacterized protein n=1 Tax=Portunus trituberculatus TaxID=210409 RepID=A0A5B7HYV2_PORTR|nr:hypothetical protein [Portunus trituberculatus]
MWSSDACQRS